MVEIYTTGSHCAFCTIAKNFMKDNNIAFTEYNIEEDEDRRNEAVQTYHAQGVPLIVVNGTPVYGFKPEEIMSLINKPAVV